MGICSAHDLGMIEVVFLSVYMNSYKEGGVALSWVVKTGSEGKKQCVTGLWLSRGSVTGLSISCTCECIFPVYSSRNP